MDYSNPRVIQKQVLAASIISLEAYQEDLYQALDASKVAQIVKDIKDQRYSNIFYLPEVPHVKEEFIVYLDQIFCVPTEDMVIFQQNIDRLRMAALDNFGFYLFVLKLSYHLNRLPEDLQR